MNRERTKKNARRDAATSKRAKQEKHQDSDNSYHQNTTPAKPAQQGFLAELLLQGKENALPGWALVKRLGLKGLRELTQLVERERKCGVPICASTDTAAPGYYLADSPAELEKYLRSLDRRLCHIRLTRECLTDTLAAMSGQTTLSAGKGGEECG